MAPSYDGLRQQFQAATKTLHNAHIVQLYTAFFQLEHVEFCVDIAISPNQHVQTALGGIRLRNYAEPEMQHEDTARLADGMAAKYAITQGIEGCDTTFFSGGKCTVNTIKEKHRRIEKEPYFREEFMKRVGQIIADYNLLTEKNLQHGHEDFFRWHYIASKDSGITPADVATWKKSIPDYAAGIADPSPCTAQGVEQALYFGIERTPALRERKEFTAAYQGLGHVGMPLLGLLAQNNAYQFTFFATDKDAAKVRAADEKIMGGKSKLIPLDYRQIIQHPVHYDIYSPNALGQTLNSTTQHWLKSAGCRLVCGAANNQLAQVENGDFLFENGITYLPDYIVNAGGIICVDQELKGKISKEHKEEINNLVRTIVCTNLEAVFAAAEKSRIAPHRVADKLAAEILKTGKRPESLDGLFE